MKPLALASWRLRLSVKQTLLIITAALTLMIAVLAARDLMSNLDRAAQTRDLRAAIAVSDQLFQATGAVSVERDLALALLQAPEGEAIGELGPLLQGARQEADRTVAAALAALDQRGLENMAELRGQLAAHYQPHAATQASARPGTLTRPGS
jgi:hypothetical protein